MPAVTQTEITFEIPGCPPSPNRTRFTREDPELTAWRERATYHARGAANRAHWPKPPPRPPIPAPRWVSVVLYRRHLLDEDHAWASVTPVINGLKGSLLVDDSPEWCRLWSVRQERHTESHRDRTVVTVSLVAPA
jgi:hypothetical protein